MQARVYLPAYGRFASPDPGYDQYSIAPETLNLYVYVADNPVSRMDLTGEGWGDVWNYSKQLAVNTGKAAVDLAVNNFATQAALQVHDLIGTTIDTAVGTNMFPRLSNLGQAAENGASGLQMAAHAVRGPTELMTAAVVGVGIGKATSALRGAVGQLVGDVNGGAGVQTGIGGIGAIDAPIGTTTAGERFVRVGARPENLKFTFDTPGGTQAGTYAFTESTFNQIGQDPAAWKNFGDLPGDPPQYFRFLEPPAGTPIQRGIVPGGEYGGEGGVPEVRFPEGY